MNSRPSAPPIEPPRIFNRRTARSAGASACITGQALRSALLSAAHPGENHHLSGRCSVRSGSFRTPLSRAFFHGRPKPRVGIGFQHQQVRAQGEKRAFGATNRLDPEARHLPRLQRDPRMNPRKPGLAVPAYRRSPLPQALSLTTRVAAARPLVEQERSYAKRAWICAGHGSDPGGRHSHPATAYAVIATRKVGNGSTSSSL